MSTRSTLAHGDSFHVFVDWFQAGTISIELKGVPFEARPTGVKLDIPLELWERIRAVTVDPSDYWDEDERELESGEERR